MDIVNTAIWKKFNMKRGGCLPYMTWRGTRDTFAELLGELNFNKGAEVGVQSGMYSEVLLVKNPNLHLQCVDPWSAYLKVSDEQSEVAYQLAIKRLEPYKDRVTFVRKPSVEASRDFPDNSLDFVYIDGAHDFDNVMLDILHWVPKVKRGGIISGHDYYVFFRGGVIKAVDYYIAAHGISMWYVTKELLRTWFWVNP